MHRDWTLRVIRLALVVAVCAVFGRSLWEQHGFVNYDDQTYVVNNPHVRTGLSLENLRWALSAVYASNWHPLTWLSLQFDAYLYGPKSPEGFHFTNLLLHAASALLLFEAIRRMTGAVWRSAVVAGLFALHPLHVESVAWVAERKDVLSSLFWMLTLLAYAIYAERPSLGRYLLVVGAFVLGLCAKPMLVTLPFVLLLLDVWPLHRLNFSELAPASVGRLLVEKLPLFALAAISSGVTFWAQQQGGSVSSLILIPPGVRAENALVSYVSYLGMTLWPVHLSVFYPHPRQLLPWPEVVGAGVLLVAVTGAVIGLRRRYPYLLVGWLWYVGTLVPVIGLVQVGGQALADRYTYIPLIGLFWAGTWAVADLANRLRLPAVVIGGATATILAACAVLSFIQVGYWRDSVTLWEHALEVNPNNYLAHNDLGEALASRNRLDEAIQHYTRALEIKPDLTVAVYSRGVAHAQQGMLNEASADFSEALRLNPEFSPAAYNLGMAELQRGQRREAAAYFARALEIRPEYPEAQVQLGAALIELGEPKAAREHLEEAVRLQSADAMAQAELGLAMALLGDFTGAIPHFRRAISLRPTDGRWYYDLASALHEQGQAPAAAEFLRKAKELNGDWPQTAEQRARMLATQPDAAARNGILALYLARLASWATGDQQPEFLDTLGAAHAERGQFEQAIRAVEAALQRATEADRRDLRPGIEQRLRLYREHKPFRQAAESAG